MYCAIGHVADITHFLQFISNTMESYRRIFSINVFVSGDATRQAVCGISNEIIRILCAVHERIVAATQNHGM